MPSYGPSLLQLRGFVEPCAAEAAEAEAAEATATRRRAGAVRWCVCSGLLCVARAETVRGQSERLGGLFCSSIHRETLAALAKAEKPRSGERVFSLSIYVYTHHEHERVCLNDNFSKGVRRRSLLFLSFAVKVSAEWPVLAALRSAPRLIPSVFRACPVVRPRPAVRPSRCGR